MIIINISADYNEFNIEISRSEPKILEKRNFSIIQQPKQ